MMARTQQHHRAASLVALIVLFLLPVRPVCTGGNYKSLSADRAGCCVSKDEGLKSFHDFDYDNFVGLMGRRRAAQSNSHRNDPMSRARHMEHILSDLLRRKTSE